MLSLTQKTEELQQRAGAYVSNLYFSLYGIDVALFPPSETAEASLYGDFAGSVDFTISNPQTLRVVFFQSPHAVFVPASLTDLAIGEVEFAYISEEIPVNSILQVLREDMKDLLFKVGALREQGLTLTKFRSYEISSYER